MDLIGPLNLGTILTDVPMYIQVIASIVPVDHIGSVDFMPLYCLKKALSD